MKTLVSFLILIVSQLVQAKSLNVSEIRFCYYNFREEMSTAAVIAGDSKGYFREQGIVLKYFNNDALVFSRNNILTQALFNEAAEKKIYFNQGIVNEVGLVQKTIEQSDCDIAVVNAEAVLLNKNNSNLKMLSSYLYGGQYDTHMLVASNLKADSVKDLKGKKVRVGRLATYFLLEKILNESGMSEKDVVIVKESPDNLSLKLSQSDISAVIAYNPTVPLLLASGQVRVLKENLFSTYLKPYIPSSVLISSKKFAKNKKDLIKKFMKAYVQSTKLISENPEEVVNALKSSQGNHFKYTYTNAEIERAASIMKLAEPFYFDKDYQAQSSSPFTHDSVKAAFLRYQEELINHKLVAEKTNLDYL